MGCFNQSCFFTRLDIQHRDPCYIFPIVKNEDSESLNDGPFRHFQPFCLPIEGRYDDYGGIEKIVQNENTEALEKFFEVSIEYIAEAFCDGRKDKYGEYSTIQKLYGVPDVFITPESLKKVGFETDDNNIVTHPVIEHYATLNTKNGKWPENLRGKVTGKWEGFTLKWLENGDLELAGYYEEPYIFKANSRANVYDGLFYRLESPFKFLRSKHYYSDEYIFGIPKKYQGRAQLLLTLDSSFLRKEVWTELVGNYQEHCDEAYTYRAEWRQKDIEKFLPLVKEMREANIKAKAIKKDREENKGKKTQTKDEMSEFFDIMYAAEGRGDFSVHGLVYSFTNRNRLKDFKNIYLDYFDNQNILDMLFTFGALTRAMYAGNILLIDSNSLEQHGDIREQMLIHKLIGELGQKIKGERDQDYED